MWLHVIYHPLVCGTTGAKLTIQEERCEFLHETFVFFFTGIACKVYFSAQEVKYTFYYVFDDLSVLLSEKYIVG